MSLILTCGNGLPRRGVALMCAATLMVTGCATPRPKAEWQPPQTHLAIVAVPTVPETNFRAFAKSRFGGTFKGAGMGASAGFLGGLSAGGSSSASGPFGAAVTVLVAVVAAVVGTGVGAVQGYRHSVPSETAEQIDSQIDTMLARAGFSAAIVQDVLQQTRHDPDFGQWPILNADYATNYAPLADKGISEVVEVSVPAMGFESSGGWNAAFFMTAKVRIANTRDGTDLNAWELTYKSSEEPAESWFENNGHALESEFEKGTTYLAEHITDDVFLGENFPFYVRAPLPGYFGIFTCWFSPRSPQQDAHNLFSRIYFHPHDPVAYGMTDSLQPTFKWDPLPRPEDQTPQNAGIIAKISDVRYDIRIWEALDDRRGPLEAEGVDLPAPTYTPDTPLKPNTKYFWSFRAHYRLGGAPLRTGWAILWEMEAGCIPNPVPDNLYFRFVTPEAGSQ